MLMCRRFIILLLAALLIGCPGGSARTQQKALIRAGEGIGPIHVYQTKEEVVKKVGQPDEVHDYSTQLVWYYYAPFNKDSTKIQIIFAKKPNTVPRVKSVTISGARGIFTTPEGVVLGMSVEEATSRLGSRKSVQSGELQYKGDLGLLVLYIRKGRVDRIQCHISDSAAGWKAAAAKYSASADRKAAVNGVKGKGAAKNGKPAVKNGKPAAENAGTAAAKAPAAARNKAMIRAGEGIGPIHMYQTCDEVVKKVGKPNAVTEASDHISWAYYAPCGSGTTRIDIIFAKTPGSAPKVNYVAISGAKGIFATPEGVTLGMTPEEVKTRLGAPYNNASNMFLYHGSPGKMVLQFCQGRVDRIMCSIRD